MLQTEHLIAKIGADTAETGLPKDTCILPSPIKKPWITFEGRERELLRELRDATKRRWAKACLYGLQAEEVEEEETTDRGPHS